jgi:hypothetical protein
VVAGSISAGAKLPLRTSTTLIVIGTIGMWLQGHQLSNIAILGWYILFMLGMGTGYGNLMTFGLNQLSGQYAHRWECDF